MTRDDILSMAREAGLLGGPVYAKGIEAFAALIRADERDRAMRENAYVAAEREACAKVCDTQAASTYWEGAYACAAAIRARSET